MSKFLDKPSNIRDLEIQSRLNKLCEQNKSFNRGDGGSRNNFSLLSHPPNFPNPRMPPSPSDLFNILTFWGLTDLLTTRTLILIFQMVMSHQLLIHHQLVDLEEIFFLNRPTTSITSSNVRTKYNTNNEWWSPNRRA